MSNKCLVIKCVYNSGYPENACRVDVPIECTLRDKSGYNDGWINWQPQKDEAK